MEKTFQVWSIAGSPTCIPIERADEWRAKGQLDPAHAKLLHEFRASTKRQMMTQYYELMGWGHYSPVDSFHGGDSDEDETFDR